MKHLSTDRWAVEFMNGTQVIEGCGELQRLHDEGVRFTVLGQICDSREYGDNCCTDCPHYRQGTCPAVTIHDYSGARWHVQYHEVHHNY